MVHFTDSFLSLLISLVGVFTTVIITSYFTRRWQMRSKLIFYINEPVSLYNDVTKAFKSFVIKLNNIPVTDNIVYLSGCFIYSGARDLFTSKNEVSIILPEGCEWLDCKISESDSRINASIQFRDKNIARMRFDTLSVNDSITLNAIVNGNKELIYDCIKLNNRIPGTEVEIFSENKKNSLFKYIEVLKFPSLLFLILAALIVYTSNGFSSGIKIFIYSAVSIGLIVYFGIIASSIKESLDKIRRDSRITIMNAYKVKGKRKFS